MAIVLKPTINYLIWQQVTEQQMSMIFMKTMDL